MSIATLAIWLQWIESTIWYPTVLTFGAVAFAFIGMNNVSDAALAPDKIFTLVAVPAIYWLATFIAMKGLNWVGKISKRGGLIGAIIPAKDINLTLSLLIGFDNYFRYLHMSWAGPVILSDTVAAYNSALSDNVYTYVHCLHSYSASFLQARFRPAAAPFGTPC